MQEDRCFDVGKPILGPQMVGTTGIQGIIIKPNTELFRGIKQRITKGEASNLPCNSTPVHHFWMFWEGWWPSRPGEGWCSSHEGSRPLRQFIWNAEFTSHFPTKRMGPIWGFLAEKTNKTKRKEKEERDFFITFCLGLRAVVFKRMWQTSVHLWGVSTLLCICWDFSEGEIMQEPPSTPFACSIYPPLLPHGSPLDAAVTGSPHVDPLCKSKEIQCHPQVCGSAGSRLAPHSPLGALPGGSWQGPEDLSLENTSQLYLHQK